MQRRLRLLWVMPSLPRRGRSAAQERAWALLAQLAIRHEVHLLAFTGDGEATVPDSALPANLAVIHRVACAPQWTGDPLALLPPTVRAGLADPRARTAVAAVLRATRFDIVQYEQVEMGHIMPRPECPVLLTMHQVSSAQIAPQWRAAGHALTQAPAALFRAWRDADFEHRAVRRAHRVIALSAADAARVHRLAPEVPVSVVPMGVDCAHFQPRPAVPATSDLLFVGHFAHPPNEDAVIFLVRDVLPRLGRSLRLRIVGHQPTAAVRALAIAGQVEVVGSVDDLRDELATARVFVAPVRFGTGMRGKVLEALAMGRPVITTSLGAEGLGARDGQELLLACDARACAAAIERVLDDPRLAASLGAAGRALAVAHFDWPIVAALQEAVYAVVVNDPPPAPLPWVDQIPVSAQRIAQLGYLPGLLTGAAVLGTRSLRRHFAARSPGGR